MTDLYQIDFDHYRRAARRARAEALSAAFQSLARVFRRKAEAAPTAECDTSWALAEASHAR